jgi:hypothetical protein
LSRITPGEVWRTLSAIDVSEHVEKKNGLSYLSWAWAWGVLKQNYPQAEFEFREWPVETEPIDKVGPTIDCMMYSDGTASVHCSVSIDDVGVSMWLPVMDYRNKAIPNPDARSISDSKMRCLVKCIAMLGLGHYIYAGEDLPGSADEAEKPQQDAKVKPKNKKSKKEKEAPQESDPGEGVLIAYQAFLEECDTYQKLIDFWRENQVEIEKLKGKELHKQIMESFSNKKKELIDGSG